MTKKEHSDEDKIANLKKSILKCKDPDVKFILEMQLMKLEKRQTKEISD